MEFPVYGRVLGGRGAHIFLAFFIRPTLYTTGDSCERITYGLHGKKQFGVGAIRILIRYMY